MLSQPDGLWLFEEQGFVPNKRGKVTMRERGTLDEMQRLTERLLSVRFGALESGSGPAATLARR